jgi:hypothetical protein
MSCNPFYSSASTTRSSGPPTYRSDATPVPSYTSNQGRETSLSRPSNRARAWRGAGLPSVQTVGSLDSGTAFNRFEAQSSIADAASIVETSGGSTAPAGPPYSEIECLAKRHFSALLPAVSSVYSSILPSFQQIHRRNGVKAAC